MPSSDGSASPGFIASRLPGDELAARHLGRPCSLIAYACEASWTLSRMRIGAQHEAELGGHLAAHQRDAARAARRPRSRPPAGSGRSRSRARATSSGERVAHRTPGSARRRLRAAASAASSSPRRRLLGDAPRRSGEARRRRRAAADGHERQVRQARHERQQRRARRRRSAAAAGWRDELAGEVEPRFDSPPSGSTIRPVAVEISSAGIWAARPSPTVSSV